MARQVAVPEIPFSEVSYHDGYKRLAAIVGKAKLGQEHWPEWARLQERYGWGILCRAADRCEPLSRWPASIEAICIVLHKDDQDAMQSPSAPIPPLSKEERQSRAALFAQLREKYA